jgi:hypothetical protein
MYGESFTNDIVGLKHQTKMHKILKPKVSPLLQSMKDAVAAEDQRLEEIRLLEEERLAALETAKEAKARQIADDIRRRVQSKLRGLCPAGFSCCRQGGGWRCHGGSRWASNQQLG